MKIIHTMPDIDKEASGPSYSVVRLCESLRALGDDSVIALIGKNKQRDFIKQFPLGIGPRRLGRSPAMHHWLCQEVKRSNVDIVHNHSLWMMPNVYPGWATKDSAIPYVVSPRGTLSEWAMGSGSKIKKIFWPLVQRPSIIHATCFHATSEGEVLDIRRQGFKQPIALIPNGIDLPSQYKFNANQKSRRTLLYLGRLHPIKGIDYLLQSWRFLQDEFLDWDLRIAGPTDNKNAEALIEMSSRLGLKRVNFSGPVYGTGKFDAYSDSALYVLPTHSENFAVTVAESLACGTPVVVSQGAPWSGVVDKNAGWWPPVGFEPLLDSLRIAMATPTDKLIEMGANGRKWMAEDFSWEGIAKKMSHFYQWIKEQSRPPNFINFY